MEAETSIGSSNVDEFEYSTPRRAPLIHLGNRSNVLETVNPREEAPEKTKGKGKQISLPLTIYSAEKTRIKGKPTAVPSGKTDDTSKVMFMPISCSKVNSRNREKENIEPFSCPPLSKTRKKKTVSNEAGNTYVSNSFTAPHQKHNKKKRLLLVDEDDSVHALPQEYIEQQRAYFKEIDSFELVEEEVSENESDNVEQVVKLLTL